MQRRIDQQAFTVRVETDDERAIHDLSGKERSLKRHYHKHLARLVGRLALFVSHATWIRVAERARPNIQRIVLVRRQPTQLRAIGRDFRIRTLWIAKKDFAWNERGKFGVNRKGAKPDDRTEKIFHIDCHFPT